ncbi:MAG: helicase-exonuclease AddAB subunit AddA [Oscillospiraceae bacterium]|nr:helicase-exonuclease AddAB subunit AddA [Oscillospiraceae bacterium]
MSKWTKEQLDAITARNTGIIVSAAAGSGKTSVLVERLLRILADTENQTPADRLVVVTFTNDAAAQMKRRLSDALAERIAAEPDNDWLCRQQTLLQTAKISTIHSFCFDLIRENIRSLDISAGFRILDETEEALLIRKAADNAFEALYGEQPEKMELLADFFSGSTRGDEALEETILELYDFFVSLPFYEDWLHKQAEFYSAGFDSGSDPFAEAYIKRIRSEYVRLLKKAEYANQIFGAELGVSSALENDIDQFERLIEAIDNNTEWDKRIFRCEIKFARFDSPRGLDENGKLLKDKILEIRNGYKKKYDAVRKGIYTEAEIIDDYKKHAEILTALSDVIGAFAGELSALKAEKNALGFSDAEQLAIKLLAVRDENGCIVKTPLAKELEAYYSIIMIDEFQDANNTQDLIFKMLSKGGTSEKGGTSLFAVGDVKQSIYRFRQANPQLFLDALEKSESYTGEDFSGTNAAIFLNRNFRSSSDVISFVNYCFGLLMSRSVGEVDYTDTEALVQGLEYPEGDRSTEFIIVPVEEEAVPEDVNINDDENEVDESSDGEEPLDVSAAACEARAAAEKIKSMLGVRTVLDGGEERPCEPRDFCILLRNSKGFEIYINELAALGITAHSEEPAGYLRSREISVLTSLLAVIDDPMKDIPLATVLMSPMFMLTAEDMAQLASVKGKKEKYFTVIRSVLNGETEIPSVSQLGIRLGRFMQTFDKLRYCAASQRPERLIRTIYDSTDFLSAVQVFKDGSRKRANLRLLLDLAESYEKSSGGGLSGFVRYIDTVIRRGGDFKRASVVSQSENAVSVKTIHRSKGLEYPFVFLCGTSTKFNIMDTRKRVQINSDFGIGFKIQDRKKLRLYNSFPVEVIKESNLSNMKSEEMRLLYVALTRAREQIFITVPDSEKVRKRISAVREDTAASGEINAASADSMLDWITMAMLRHPSGEWFRDGEKIPVAESDPRVRICRYEPEKRSSDEEDGAKRAEPDMASVSRLEKMFSFGYDDTLTKKSAKITVTEISKSGDEDRIYLRRPEFAAERGGLTAAEKGTAMHTFMQYADYSAAEADPDSEADRLADNGLLSFEERESLDIGQLKGFFRSELYERMKSSGMVRREQKFLIKKSDAALDDFRLMEYNDNSMLQGIADCMFEEDGELVLVDYKTDKVFSEGILISRYDLQLKLYSAALSKIFGKKVREAYLYSFSLGKAVRAL